MSSKIYDAAEAARLRWSAEPTCELEAARRRFVDMSTGALELSIKGKFAVGDAPEEGALIELGRRRYLDRRFEEIERAFNAPRRFAR